MVKRKAESATLSHSEASDEEKSLTEQLVKNELSSESTENIENSCSDVSSDDSAESSKSQVLESKPSTQDIFTFGGFTAEKSSPFASLAKQTSFLDEQSIIDPITITTSQEQTKILEHISTGEEDETNLLQAKAKLFWRPPEETSGDWNEKGLGFVRINKYRNSTSKKSVGRMIMRAEGTLRILLNMNLYQHMKPTRVQEKNIQFFGLEKDKSAVFLLRLKSSAEAEECINILSSLIK